MATLPAGDFSPFYNATSGFPRHMPRHALFQTHFALSGESRQRSRCQLIIRPWHRTTLLCAFLRRIPGSRSASQCEPLGGKPMVAAGGWSMASPVVWSHHRRTEIRAGLPWGVCGQAAGVGCQALLGCRSHKNSGKSKYTKNFGAYKTLLWVVGVARFCADKKGSHRQIH